MGQFQDLTGKKFGKLTVIERGQDHIFPSGNAATTWVCQCECGNIKTIIGNSLKNGLTHSCGCLQKGIGQHRRIKEEDMLGKRFGRLIVKESVPISESPNAKYDYWLCDCDCGTKNCLVSGVALRRKKGTKSCGCLNIEMSHIKNTIDITGEKYGHLTVIKEHNGEKSPSGSILWECKCDCGNTCIVSSNALRYKNTISCGCIVSKNEERIQKILNNHNINFKSQYYFDDLRSPITNWVLKFDFGIFNNKNQLDCLIEYDGEQHEWGCRYSSDASENEKKFKKLVYYDYLKNKYCLTHHIPLFRIDYRQKDILEEKVGEILNRRNLINGI